MRRFVTVLLFALVATLAPAIAPPSAPLVAPAPAMAGVGYWSPSGCNADVEWLRNDQGVWYWDWTWSPSYGAVLVANGYYLDTYAAYGYECGFLGAPRSNRYYTDPAPPPLKSRQDFVGGRIMSNF